MSERSDRHRSRALLLLGVAGVALGIVVALRGLEAALALVIGWGFIGAGLYAWWRRPQNRVGALMTATGFLFFVSELAASNASAIYTICTRGATSSSRW